MVVTVFSTSLLVESPLFFSKIFLIPLTPNSSPLLFVASVIPSVKINKRLSFLIYLMVAVPY